MPRNSRRRGSNEDGAPDGITYDAVGRIDYHPDFHPKHRKPFTTDELIYLCRFHGKDDLRKLSFAIGKTEHTIATRIAMLRKDGRYDLYRDMSLEEWEQLAPLVEENNE